MAFNRTGFGQSELPGPLQHPPGYGLLTRTLVRSPVVKQIIPARIRGRNYNDVIFIGETFIELYLLSDDGKLRKVATKTDFQADIRHARVCAFDSASASTAHSYGGYEEIPENKNEKIPPHMLVLSLDSGHLGFLIAEQRGRTVEFKMSTRRIDAKGPHPKHLGKSLAIDPTSRFLAVAAYQETFRLFALFGADEITRQFNEGIQLNPIKEEKTFHVNGVILHMEFLYPPADDPDHVTILLVVVDPKKKFRLMMYEWEATSSLQTVMKHGQQGLRLSEDLSVPLHVIPLLIDRGFLMITEFAIYALRADEVGSGRSNFAKHAFPQTDRGEGRQSLVTSWARPLRTSTHTKTMDDLYLAMEDGDIYFIEVEVGGPNLVQLVNKAGTLDCAVGSAFAALDYGLQRNDLLVAGGEMSSGGVYLLKIGPTTPLSDARADEEPRLEETVANWSPVFDFDLINPVGDKYAHGKAMRDRMYACTGRALHGAIAEIRQGIQGTILTAVTYEPGVRQLWAIPEPDEKGFFILCALANRSTICYLRSVGDWEDASHYDLLDTQHTTLAAAMVDHRTVQITTHAINVNQLRERLLIMTEPSDGDTHMADSDMVNETKLWSKPCEAGKIIVAAAISGTLMVIAVRSEGLVKVTLMSLTSSPDASPDLSEVRDSVVELDEDPSFITIFELDGTRFAAIGTRKASVVFYRIDAESGLHFVYEQSMLQSADTNNIPTDQYICESVCPIKGDSSSQMLFGLRDGTLRTFRFQYSPGIFSLSKLDDIQFGPLPVKVTQNPRKTDSVLLLAGPELFKYQLVGDETVECQIIFEDLGSVSEPALAAFCFIESSILPEDGIICATRDQLFAAQLGHTHKECVRRMPLLETPRRLLYNKKTNLLIVACSKSISQDTNERLPGGGKRQIRTTMCSLKFLDPQTGEQRHTGQLTDKTTGDLIFGKPNEQIYGLCEWNVRIEKTKYQYIAIGTGFLAESPLQSTKGSVIILSLSLVEGVVEVKRRYQISLDAPVYSVAPYGADSIVYCSGNRLVMRTLNMQRKKPDVVCEFKLRSPAVQITVREPFIIISCARDSLCVLKVERKESLNGMETTINTWFSDQITRNSFSHFSPQEDIYIISDKHYGIAGLWQPPERRSHGSLATLFDTQVGSSISRIRCGNLRPPWNANKSRPGVIMPDRDIIGSGVDGSIYHLMILDEEASQMLRYIQGLYITFKANERGAGYSDDALEEIGLKGDIDGDLLLLVVRMGVQWLKDAVERSEAAGHARSAPTLNEMVRKVFRIGSVQGLGEVGVLASVQMAMDYMKELLHGIAL